jgi:hypothetical protein
VWHERRTREREDDDARRRPDPVLLAPPADAVLALQRSAGNHAVSRLLVARVILGDGTDSDDLTIRDLRTRFEEAEERGDDDELDRLREVLTERNNKRKLTDSEETDLDETIFRKHKIFKGVPEPIRDQAAYLERNPESRPPAPSGLFARVYGAATPHGNGLLRIRCRETYHSPVSYVYFEAGGSERETDQHGNVLGSPGKRPPICHIDAYNHLMRAWLDLMQTPSYHGVFPDTAGYDDEHKELAWGDVNNLRPGHNHCNSSTSANARNRSYSQTVMAKVRAWARGKGWL